MPTHDIIVIGGSAGALESLRELLPHLPAGLPAAVFIATHMLPYGRSYLPDILTRAGPLPAATPEDREPFAAGRIYVPPPDHHLLVGRGFVRVVQGPKEHGMRPAIDPLFRTAAVSYGPRVVGVVLSGLLDDGTLGLSVIRDLGGVAIIQDPDEALYPDMPASALRGAGAHRLTLQQIARKLAKLACEPVDENSEVSMASKQEQYEAAIASWDKAALQNDDRPGQPSAFTCPDCHGDLWEVGEGNDLHYRCRIGHAWSLRTLAAGQGMALDETLNEAFRSLKEKADTERRLAKRAQETGSERGAAYHHRHAQNAERCAGVIWEMLLNLKAISLQETPSSDARPDAAEPEPEAGG